MQEAVDLKNTQNIFNIIEAVLFVAGEPVALQDIAQALELTELELIPVIEEMAKFYAREKRGIQLLFFNNKLQLCTHEMYAPYIQRLFHTDTQLTLTQATLETLSIIAYKQPITRSEIESVRGVKCDYSISVLTEHGLIQEVGRKDTVGRPKLLGTTDAFLKHFGLSSLSELPARPQLTQADSPDEA
ncbi:MAG: SMC-Scp complex subunit ScpB [Bacillota bacterium]